MHYGFRIVEDMIEGLNDYLDSKGFKNRRSSSGGNAVPTVQRWETLDLNYQRIAQIDYDKCIGCNLCYIACEDGAHQAIALVIPQRMASARDAFPANHSTKSRKPNVSAAIFVR